MPPYHLDVMEVGERAARAEDVWTIPYMGPRDVIIATEWGLQVDHYCAHCGQKGGH